MPSTFPSRLGRRLAVMLAVGGLLASGLSAPAAAPVRAADPLVLRVGTTQDLDSLNPFQTALVVGYEAFTLNYDTLVGWGSNLETIPGFASSWTQSADGLSWTFTIDPDLKWSDGTPATSEDARWTLQFILDAAAAGKSVGLGYLDPYVTDAGVTKVEAPDPQTLVVTTDHANSKVLQMYLPILPKHIWKDVTLDTVATFTNDPKPGAPIVGTGPYQAVEWQTGQFVSFQRNPNYLGKKGAADQVIVQVFKNADTMVQALKSGELDYAREVNAPQLDQLKTQANVVTAVGQGNGFTELGFNTYAKDIPGGGASTKALRDPAFRDALGYAVDKQLLVDKILGGYGAVGTTHVPPFEVKWHTDPATPRTFSIDTARQKLDAAGYPLDAQGRRLDKEGKPISLRLYMPDNNDTYPKSAQFIQDWYGQLGIKVTTQVFDSATLTDILLPPEAGGAANKANFDMFIWGWGGDVDPNALLKIFLTDQIGNSSDSLYSNPEYDRLFDEQNKAATDAQRKALIDQMQNIIYDQAPYDILFYDSNLHAYRTDRFAGWTDQPVGNGVPLFGYGSLDYTLLTAAGAASPSPSPSAAPSEAASPGASAAATPAPTAAPTPAPSAGDTGSSGGGSSMLLVGGIAALVVVLAVAFVAMRRRGARAEEE